MELPKPTVEDIILTDQELALLQEIEESKRWLNIEQKESTYKRDLTKRIELINRASMRFRQG